MTSAGKLFGLVGITLTITACGGGSGGGNDSSGKSFSSSSVDALKRQHQGLVDQRYTGETSLADIETNPAAIQGFTSLLIGPATILWPFPPDEFFGQVLYSNSTLPTTVNKTVSCMNGGRFSAKGDLDGKGMGNLSIDYDNCWPSYGPKLDGSAGVSVMSEDGTAFALYYDNVLVTGNNGYSEQITGFVSYSPEADQETFSFDVSLLAVHPGSGHQRKEKGTRRYGPEYYEIESELWFSDAGLVTVSTAVPLNANGTLHTGQLVFSAGNSQTAYLEFEDYDWTSLLIDTTGDSRPDKGSYFSSADAFLFADFSVINLAPIGQIGFPPEANRPTLLTANPDTTTEILVDPGYISDRDSQSSELTVSYRWSINGTLVPGTTGNSLPAGRARKDDRVTVTTLVSDGYNQSASAPLEFVIGDAPSSVTISPIPDSVQAGEYLAFTASYSDPDQAGSQPANLIYGPTGMAIDSAGNVEWTAQQTLFDSGAVHFGFGFTGDTEVYEFSIQVAGASPSLPTARSGIAVPSVNHGMFISDFLGDANNEIVTFDTSRVFALQYQSGTYTQTWMYPYRLPTGGEITAIGVADVDDDVKNEIIAATEHGISIIADNSAPARVVWETTEFIQAMAVADTNSDDVPELVILSSISDFSSSSQNLTVLELRDTVTQVFRTSLNSQTRELVIGNVDSDSQAEIILNSGLVYDGLTFANQWYRGSGFGDGSLAVGDLDNDGIDEIAAADTWGDIRVFSATSKSMLYSMDNFNTCALQIANVDLDPALELLVGDCQWGDIKAYDWASTSLALSWEVDMQDHGSKSLTVGDADNDGSNEVLWGTGISSSGSDSLIVTDLTETTPSIAFGESDSIQLDQFAAAGWGEIQPGKEQAVFIVPRTESGYDGQRLVYMNDDGQFFLTEEISGNWEGGSYGKVVDFNEDGYADIFLATAHLYDGMFKALKLDDRLEYWGTGSDYDNNVGMVDAIEMNGDSYQDALFVDQDTLNIVDIQNEVMIDQLTADSQRINDFAYAEGVASNERYLAIAGAGRLEIWRSTGGQFTLNSTQTLSCSRVQFANVDDSAGRELVCANAPRYGTGPTELVTLGVSNGSSSEIHRLSTDNRITDFVVDESKPNNQTLLIAMTIQDDFHSSSSKIQSLSPVTGKAVWSSPELIGTVAHRSMHFRPDVTDRRDRLMFATDRAMYLVK